MLKQSTKNTHRILIADDDPVIIDIVQTLVESEGYDAVTVQDGLEAYKILLKDDDFRAIILDMQMPNMEGSDLLRQMQAEKRLSRIPVLMMSSAIDLKVLSSGFGPGAMAFVPKPFTPDQMRNTLRLIALKDVPSTERPLQPFANTSDANPPVNAIKVLLIEDNPGEAIVIEAALLAGTTQIPRSIVEVSHANRASTGLERLRAGDIDVVLLDLSLPDSEGLETLLQLLEPDGGIPIVVLTGTDNVRVATEAMQLGAYDYLVKGQVDALGIIRAVHNAFEVSHTKAVAGN